MEKIYITHRLSLKKNQDLLAVIEQQAENGLFALYLREKDLPDREYVALAQNVQSICQRFKVPLILPGHLPFLKEFPQAWIQAGKSTLTIPALRKTWGQKRTIIYSAHSLPEAIEASQMTANYLFVSPIYPTVSKNECPPMGTKMLEEICNRVPTPVFALGGIQAQHFQELEPTGIKGIAGISLFQD